MQQLTALSSQIVQNEQTDGPGRQTDAQTTATLLGHVEVSIPFVCRRVGEWFSVVARGNVFFFVVCLLELTRYDPLLL